MNYRVLQSSFNLMRSNRAGYTNARGTARNGSGVPRSTTLNWNGLGGDDNWTTSLNWAGNTPTNGDSLVFTGGTRLTPVNNISSLTLMSIAFPGSSAFSVSGNQVSMASGSLSSTSTAAQTISNPLAITGVLALSSTSAQNFSVTGAISGSGSITKSGSGIIQLGVDAGATAGTYSGGTTITAGTLRMAQQCDGVLGSGAVTINGASAILSMNRIALSNAIVIGASGGRINTDNGFGCWVSGGVTLSGPCVLDTQFNCTYSGVISGTGTLTQQNSNTATVTTTPTYTGATIISAGTLKLAVTSMSSVSYAIASGAVLEFSPGSATSGVASTTITGAGTLRKTGAGALVHGSAILTMNMAAGGLIDVVAGEFTGGNFGNEVWTSNLADLAITSGATFDGIEANVRVNSVSGAGSLKTGYTGAGYAEMVIGVNNGTGATFSGVIADSVNAGSIRKAGTGTQTLSGASTYTGTTTVAGGTLSITGSLSASSAVTVDGGVLRGTGTVGAVTVANTANSAIHGGTGAAGTLTTGALTFSGSTAALRVNTDGTSTVSVVAAAAVTLGSVTVNFNTGLALTAGTYNVITGTSMTGTATQGTLPPSRTWTSLTVVGNNLVAVLA